MIVAFIVSGAAGLVVEWGLIQRLYARPLDTLLATWGLSLIMQQAFRSGFGAREVGVELPPWMMGSLQVTDTIEVQINGLFVMGLTLLITAGVAVLLFRSRWGLQVRGVVANRTMAGAAGIDTRRIDRFTFGLGCGIAGVAGSAFTMIGSTGPTAGQLYIVDTFLVVVFGGAQSLLGTVASAFTISQSQSTLEFFLTGSMAKVLTLLIVIGILMLRPQGLFALKVQKVSADVRRRAHRYPRRLELIGIALVAVIISDLSAARARHLPAQSRRQVSHLRVRRHRFGAVLGTNRNSQPGAGFVLRARRLLHGRLPQARGLERRQHQDPIDARHSRLHGLESAARRCRSSGFRSNRCRSPWSRSSLCRRFWPSFSARRMFKRRVGGVYFAIITQALALVMTILIVGQQGYTGGINGITDLRTLLGWDIRTDSAKYILYFVCCVLLLGTMFLARFVLASKLGRILVATRDKEDRVRFSGYDVANYKIFVFCLASAMAGVGGAMFTLQVGFMSPSFVGIVPSIDMVIFCAVGGRNSIVGAVAGTLLVNWAKTMFSEAIPASSGCSRWADCSLPWSSPSRAASPA